MRIERSQHAADRRLDELLIGDLAAVSLVDHVHHLGVETKQVVRFIGERQKPVAHQRAEDQAEDEQGNGGELPGAPHDA